MSMKILTLLHTEMLSAENRLSSICLETLNVAKFIAQELKAELIVGVWGGADILKYIDDIKCSLCKKVLYYEHPDLGYGNYNKDSYVIQKFYEYEPADIVIAPASSRINRVIGGVAYRVKGYADTHVCGFSINNSSLKIKRWYYKQRILVEQERTHKPWFITLDSQVFEPLNTQDKGNYSCIVEKLNIEWVPQNFNSNFVDFVYPTGTKQTIKPDAKILFVAGAGWTKKQANPQNTVEKAAELIETFLEKTGASLGGSKSIVDLSGEGQSVLPFMTHLNQVGQTGSTPRHPKGIATCCYGEEPHVVGWRFINNRIVINIDPNCGWTRGKADVVYVGDAFEIIKRVNELLDQK